MTKPFSTDIINHRGEEITVNTFIDDSMKVTEEFARKGFKFVLSGEGRILTMYSNGKHPRHMTEAQENMALTFKERCLYQAVSKDLETYCFNGKRFTTAAKCRCCDTMVEQMSLIDVADWMISQF